MQINGKDDFVFVLRRCYSCSINTLETIKDAACEKKIEKSGKRINKFSQLQRKTKEHVNPIKKF